uniref:Uncharacterized protein n=1 Tax=Candidozyma auris TaxID=498019 RepID=A0A0L0P2X0_CANAR
MLILSMELSLSMAKSKACLGGASAAEAEGLADPNLAEFEDNARSHGNSPYEEIALQLNPHNPELALMFVRSLLITSRDSLVTPQHVRRESITVNYKVARDTRGSNSKVRNFR